jgi:hypothetical protein
MRSGSAGAEALLANVGCEVRLLLDHSSRSPIRQTHELTKKRKSALGNPALPFRRWMTERTPIRPDRVVPSYLGWAPKVSMAVAVSASSNRFEMARAQYIAARTTQVAGAS